MSSQPTMKTSNKITCGKRMIMIFCPLFYSCKPEMSFIDCCHHEPKKADILNIPPLIQMSSTWLNYNLNTPIPTWFYTLRNLLTLGLITITMYNLSIYIFDGIVIYWPIYFTQWNILLATVLMIIKSISTNEVYKFIKLNSTISLYTHQLKPYTKLWTLYVIDNILLQITIVTQPIIAFNYWYIDKKFNISTCFGSILILTDFILSAERSYYKSLIWPILFGMIFTLWTIIFEIAGWKNDEHNRYIYSEMNWSEDVVTPIIMLLISIVIYIAFTLLLTFVKNLILIKSGFGQRCIQMKQIVNIGMLGNNVENGAKNNDANVYQENNDVESVNDMESENHNGEQDNHQGRDTDQNTENYDGESVNDIDAEYEEWSIKVSIKVVDDDDEDDN